jgi:uncharacterized protein YrrD
LEELIERSRTLVSRLEIRPGSTVTGTTGVIGKVDRLVVSPGSGEVTGLVVRKGLLLRRDVVIPIGAVERADENEVRVGLAAEELDALPEYREQDYVAPPADWRSPSGQPNENLVFDLSGTRGWRDLHPAQGGQVEPAAGGRPIRAGQRVVCRDGTVGKVDLVLVDPTSRRATHIVVRRGTFVQHDIIVPVEWAREITRDEIVLDATREQIEMLPEYRPDDEITIDVLEALWWESRVDRGDLADVHVRTHDGIVELTGFTGSEQARQAIEATASKVRGVLGVRDRIQAMSVASLAGDTSGPQSTGRQ